MDGLIYATISHNMANGIGTFWNPSFTETLFPEFHEHPPLAIGIQSCLYSLFGHSIFIDKLYSVGMIGLTAIGIVLIWKEIGNKLQTAWIPLLFYTLIPVISWAATNNILENTMSVFVVFSVWFAIKSTKKYRFTYLFFSGILLALAWLSKGFPALFPFAFPIIYWVFTRNRKGYMALLDTGFLLISFLVPCIIVFCCFSTAFDSLCIYISKQVVGSISHVQTVDSRFFILKRTLTELIPTFILLIIGFGFARAKKWYPLKNKNLMLWCYIFLTLASTGILPIMISMKQSGFYILTTYPFLSLAAGILFYSIMKKGLENINRFVQIGVCFLGIVTLSIGITLTITNIGKLNRDKEMLTDLHILLPEIPEHSRIRITPDMWENWSLHGYCFRYKYISLDIDDTLHNYLLLKKTATLQDYNLDTLYFPIEKNTSLFDLYKKK